MHDIYTNYTNYIGYFIGFDIHEWSFKSHPSYSYMLEHVGKEKGDEYLNEIIEKFPDLYNANKNYFIELCHKNDSCGKPNQSSFSNFTTCSPTDLRYIYQSMLILSYMKECNLNNIDVIEIGGGYGGLCFFMIKLSHLFDIQLRSYSIFDLDMPRLLQQKYLEHFGIFGVNYVSLENIQGLNKNSFLISNYAFSEISMAYQSVYTTEVLNPYVSHGFIAWNNIDVYNFIDNKEILIEDEVPKTAAKNKYVRFKPVVSSSP